MASPSTVITLGFGSFGSVNLLPTLGYGIGAAVSSVIGPAGMVAGEVYRPGMMAGAGHRDGMAAGEVYRNGMMAGAQKL